MKQNPPAEPNPHVSESCCSRCGADLGAAVGALASQEVALELQQPQLDDLMSSASYEPVRGVAESFRGFKLLKQVGPANGFVIVLGSPPHELSDEDKRFNAYVKSTPPQVRAKNFAKYRDQVVRASGSASRGS